MANLQDISNITGVSTATISRILNQDPSFNVLETTRTKVLTVAEEIGYTKHLKTSKKEDTPKKSIQKVVTIGIIQMHSYQKLVEDPYYYRIECCIEMFKEKYNMKTVKIKNNHDNTFSVEGDVKVDGIFAIGIFGAKQISNMEKFSKNIVFLDSSPDEEKYYGIVPNFSSGVEQSIRYLLKRGHTDIGFIGEKYTLGDRKHRISEPRWIFFRSLMIPMGLYNEDFIIEAPTNVLEGYEATKAFLDNAKQIPSAFFIASDSIGNGIIRAIIEKGLKVPEDISLIAFNNSALSQYAMIPLTAIDVHAEKMALTAFKHMVDLLNNDAVFVRTVISCNIIERDSVARLK
ncbi:MAG: hypothetical protein ATN36_07175 [Epulopiscium sp. Nele67-Bin005]|nr:MAG: hypothetical protein ATN36_07175 [Epulopiscium sp. Nele67-Bin005]